MNTAARDKAAEGLYQKFVCYRADGEDQPGRDRAEAEYFVMDYRYDPHAWFAAAGYVVTCATQYPVLATDLARRLLAVAPAMIRHGKNRETVDKLLKEAGQDGKPLEKAAIYGVLITYATATSGSTSVAVGPSASNGGGG